MQKARTKLTPTSTRTREQLILAGERLFALHGLDNVSLRQINSEAGQRNSSASHYHFGSKESLISAVYEYRLNRLNARRNQLLATLPPAAGPRPVRILIGLLVDPMVQEIEEAEGGHNFIRVLAQLLGHPMLSLVDMWRSQMGASIGQVYYGLRATLSDVPDEIFGPRFGLTWVLAVNALANRERLAGGAGPVNPALPVLYVSNLTDMLAGMISAPVSAATHAEINVLRARGPRPD